MRQGDIHGLFESFLEQLLPSLVPDHLVAWVSRQTLGNLIEDRDEAVGVRRDDSVERILDQPFLKVVRIDQLLSGGLQYVRHVLEGVGELDHFVTSMGLVDFASSAAFQFLRKPRFVSFARRTIDVPALLGVVHIRLTIGTPAVLEFPAVDVNTEVDPGVEMTNTDLVGDRCEFFEWLDRSPHGYATNQEQQDHRSDRERDRDHRRPRGESPAVRLFDRKLQIAHQLPADDHGNTLLAVGTRVLAEDRDLSRCRCDAVLQERRVVGGADSGGKYAILSVRADKVGNLAIGGDGSLYQSDKCLDFSVCSHFPDVLRPSCQGNPGVIHLHLPGHLLRGPEHGSENDHAQHHE